MAQRKTVGDWGEALAARYLTEHGYAIRARNWRAKASSGTSHGELDIVAEREGVIHFVEVRTRRSDAYGTPEETFTSRKRAKLLETASAYIATFELHDRNWQMDALVIELDGRNHVRRLEHIERAIG